MLHPSRDGGGCRHIVVENKTRIARGHQEACTIRTIALQTPAAQRMTFRSCSARSGCAVGPGFAKVGFIAYFSQRLSCEPCGIKCSVIIPSRNHCVEGVEPRGLRNSIESCGGGRLHPRYFTFTVYVGGKFTYLGLRGFFMHLYLTSSCFTWYFTLRRSVRLELNSSNLHARMIRLPCQTPANNTLCCHTEHNSCKNDCKTDRNTAKMPPQIRNSAVGAGGGRGLNKK